MRVTGKSAIFLVVAMGLVAALAACSSKEPGTPTPPPTPESALATCGGPIESDDVDTLVELYPDRSGFLWALPDGTDANMRLDDFRAADPTADESTAVHFVQFGEPVVSPDHRRAASVVERRHSGETETTYFLVFSTEAEPVAAMYEIPQATPEPPLLSSQPLIIQSWLSESGCLATLMFTPTQDQQLFLISPDGEVVAMLTPHLARGDVLDGAGDDWIVLDRSTWTGAEEIELLNINDPGTSILLSADETLPDLPGLAGAGELTGTELIALLRD